MLGNGKRVSVFTDALFELMVVQKLTLQNVLEIMKGKTEKWMKETAEFLLQELQEGNLFSNALYKCDHIHFDGTYVAFICYAEKTGTLSDAIVFLQKRCKRQEENFQNLLGALIYPVFVIVLGVCFSGFLCFGGDALFSSELINWQRMRGKFFECIFVLMIFCLISILFLKKNLGDDKLYEAFLGISFLTKSGISLGTAVGYGILVTGPGTKYGNFFDEIRNKLEYGMDIRTAIRLGVSKKICDEKENMDFLSLRNSPFTGNRRFIQELENVIYLAQKAGNQSEVFENLCRWMESKKDKSRKLCMSLLEPVFICVTGIFVFTLMINFMLPLINNTNLVL